MAKETIGWDELDKMIDAHKNNRPQKKALLVVKSTCEPFRGKEIPKEVVVKVVDFRRKAETVLAEQFIDSELEDMFENAKQLSDNLGNVVGILFGDDDEDDVINVLQST